VSSFDISFEYELKQVLSCEY